jgi:NAD(P)H-hydrate epimerase
MLSYVTSDPAHPTAQPALTRKQVRRVDQLAVTEYGFSGLVLMENAGGNAATIIDRIYGPHRQAFIICGPGNNGGDGCVIARHLHNAEWRVRVLMAGDVAHMTAETRANYRILEAMGLRPRIVPDAPAQRKALSTIQPDEVIVDALLGTGLIATVNASTKRAAVSIDVPSGFDCDAGPVGHAIVRADLTITFVARKVGFSTVGATAFLGRVEVVDIGVPRELITRVAAIK